MFNLLTVALLALSTASPVILPPDDDMLLLERSTYVPYGEGKDVAISAPGIAYHPAYKGFPSRGIGPQQSSFLTAVALNFVNPGWVPTGVNPSSCTPKTGQLPVILIPGTTETVYSNWAAIGPKLAAEGVCVYSFSHAPLAFLGIGLPGSAFMGDITYSAQALSVFVDEVLALTGASQVDLIGHSQGAGALPFYYLKNIMSGSKVRKMIGLAPSLGTNMAGLNSLITTVFSKQATTFVSKIISVASNAASLQQQLISSDFMVALHKGGLAIDGVQYFNLATKYDEVLVPYTNCNFLESGKNITNVVLQDVCAQDYSDHLGLAYSTNVYQIIRNYLFDTNNSITCATQYAVTN